MRKALLARFSLLGFLGTFLAVSVARADGPYQFFSVTPCRIADTRNPVGLNAGPAIQHAATRSFQVSGSGSWGNCNIPTNATAAVINVTVVGPTAQGFLTIWPFNTPVPLAASIVFDAGEPALGNGAIVPLTEGDPSNFNISVSPGLAGGGTNSLNLVIDVTGYFAP
jgi:hypothetical protein